MRKNLRKIFVRFLLFPITLLALVSYIYLTYTPKTLAQPVFAYFEKGQNAGELNDYLCKKTKSDNPDSEFLRAINLAKQRLMESGNDANFLEDLIDCVDIQYATFNDKTSNNKIEGKFETLSEISNGSAIRISIDQSYQQKDDLLLAFVLTHELIHTKQFFDFQKTLKMKSCFDREAEAFNAEIDLFTALNNKERASLLARIKNDKIPDTTLENLNQLIKISTKSAEICQKLTEEKLVQCFQENNLGAIKKILLLNKTYTTQCNS